MIAKTISHYKILEKLGEGGMGVVYKAEDLKLKRTVALKFLPPELTRDPEAKERFIQEAQAASALDHPNICNIHEIDETEDGQMFICMAYYDGETLKKKIASGQMSVDGVIDIAIQITQGLVKAHEHGIIHRDIKPGNIMITKDGMVKILDFGLAKLAGQVRLTKTGTTVGTIAYMSPEQARGEEVDQETDIWSLGVVIYEMVTGQLPFKGEYEQAVLYSILNEEQEPMIPAGSRRTSVPMELERITNKALAKNANERYQHVDEMSTELKSLRKELEFSTTQQQPTQLVKADKSNWKKISMVAIPLLLVVITGLAYLLFWDRGPKLKPNRVVVAIFENQTGDASLDQLGRMAADWITQGLSQTDLIEAVPTSTVWHVIEKVGVDINALAAKTGAGIAVSGAFYIVGDSLCFRAELSDVVKNKLLTPLQSASGIKSDPMNAIESLRQRIMGALAVRFDQLRRSVIIRAKPPNFDAYKEFLLGTEFFGTDYDKAIRHYKSAVELDATFMSPLLYIAVAYGNQREYVKADSIIQVVSQNRGKLSQIERYYLDWFVASLHGNYGKGLKFLRQVEKLDPNDLITNYVIGLEALRINHPQETVETFIKLDREYEAWYAHTVGRWRFGVLTSALHMLGRHKEELKQAQRARSYYPDKMATLNYEICAQAALGRIDEVKKLINESFTFLPPGTPASTMKLTARVLRAHGYFGEARELVEQAIDWYQSRPASEAIKLKLEIYDALYLSVIWDEGQLSRAEEPEIVTPGVRFLSERDKRIEMLKNIAEEFVSENPEDINWQGRLGHLAARLGNREEALRIYQWLGNLDRPYMYGNNIYWQANIATALGEYDRAVTLFQDAFRKGAPFRAGYHYDEDLEELRKYPPFQEFIKPKG